MITRALLRAVMPLASNVRLDMFEKPIADACEEFEINTPLRVAHFLAQIAHESGSLRYVRELASGADYDTGRKAAMLGNTPEDDDDGERYRGRGLIQITGTTNYRECGYDLGLDLLAKPELLEEPVNAARSAAWFWTKFKKLNAHADADDFMTITRRINGGTNGIEDRRAYLGRAKTALGV